MGFLLSFIIPPLQNPDEPQHFGMILTFVNNDVDQLEVESEIIKLMDQHHWWKYLGMGRPSDLSQGFSKIKFFDFEDFNSVLKNRTIYHYCLAKICKILPNRETVKLYFFCRAVSFIFLMLSLYIFYLTYKKILKISHYSYIFGFLFLFFLPQLLILSISVNIDALLIMLGALFFYASTSLMIEGFSKISTLLIILTSFIGLLADKSSIFFSILLFILLIILKDNKKFISLLGIILFMILIISLWAVWYFPSLYFGLIPQVKNHFVIFFAAASYLWKSPSYNLRFTLLVIDSFFLKFGWMAFSTHKFVYTIWRFFCASASLGILVFFITKFFRKREENEASYESSIFLKLVFFFSLAVLVQFGSAWIFLGGRNIAAQGRHFFSLLFPISFLFIHGNKVLCDKVSDKFGQLVIPVIIILEFIFLSYVLLAYIIPLYHISLLSPHGGL